MAAPATPTPGQLPVQQQSELPTQGRPQQLSTVPINAITNPFVDIYDSPDEITIVADMPGYDTDNVRVEANHRTLHIIGEREDEAVEEDHRTLQQERTRRSERFIQLPVEIDIDEAEATCEAGVCRITLPKSEAERQKQIGVH